MHVLIFAACPEGLLASAHQAGLLDTAARTLGWSAQVALQERQAATVPLSAAEVRQADLVVVLGGEPADWQRFAGSRRVRASVLDSQAEAIAFLRGAAERADEPVTPRRAAWLAEAYRHLLTGVSYMLPMVVAGGLLIALSFVFGIDAFKQEGTLAAALMTIGGETAFRLMVPLLAGYIAYSIAERPGLAPGMIGGLLAGNLGAGFLGGIVAGFVAGYTARAVERRLPLPSGVETLKPVLLVPLVASLITGLVMIYLVGTPVAGLLAGLTRFLEGMGAANAVLLGLLLGAMMCVDLGGPINKAAYAFSVGLLAAQSQAPMAATMAAGMVPPIGMGIATLLARRKFAASEREAGRAALALGCCFISEGAVPFAARDPLRVLPACVAGGALAGALSMYFGCRLLAPHGGVFILLIPNAINRPLAYLLAIAAGSLATGVLYALSKRAAPGAMPEHDGPRG